MKAAPTEARSARGLRIAIVRSLYNASITDGLLRGAREALAELGAKPALVRVFDVPGAFELPVAARAAARSRRFDAVIALGAVIKGGTDHYEHIAREASGGLAAVALETGVPVGFGLLTLRRASQGLARSARTHGNKGREAARAAIFTVHTLRGLRARGARA